MKRNLDLLRNKVKYASVYDGDKWIGFVKDVIPRVGKFIRKTSIDELPQLFNILKGDMSIVGPRPALPREVEQYSAYQAQRLFITPGLTCYWQIQPNRNDISFDEWVEMDIRYIRERSFLVDWKIIFKTIIVVLTKQGR